MDVFTGRFRAGRSSSSGRADRRPTCPVCQGPMAVRVARRAEGAGRQIWRCRRYPTCSGTRPLDTPAPVAHRSRRHTAQQEFDRRRVEGRWAGRRLLPSVFGSVGAARGRDPVTDESHHYLRGLAEHGYVVLHERLMPGRRTLVDHLVIGPTGVFVVETKPWPGQLARDGNRLFVDGRLRDGVVDDVVRTAAELQRLLSAELKRLSVTVVPLMCFPRSDVPLFRQTMAGAVVTGGRALTRAIRDGTAVVGEADVIDLALAADEMLEPAHR